MQDGFIKVAAGTPEIRVADCAYNAQACLSLLHQAAAEGVKVLCLPELCLTGYTCGDLFLQDALLQGAEDALRSLLEGSKDLDLLAVVGVPVRYNQKLFNCAAVFCRGTLLGLVPKIHLPNYTEFYEGRWFTSGRELRGTDFCIPFAGQESVEFSAGLLFRCVNEPLLTIGVEICEDLWVADPPSTRLAQGGATLLLNPSASDETVCKDAYRRTLLEATSGRLVCGYVYADAGWGESSTDLIYAGHSLIAENGTILAEQRFATGLTITEIDLQKLAHERQRMTTYPADAPDLYPNYFELERTETRLTRPIAPNPFVPADHGDRAARCREIDIGPAVKLHFQDIGQAMEDLSVTFENGQARERTQVLMDLANKTGGLVIGTGDLSELALGWATYNGDHMSMYAVNAGIPKTLVRHLVAYVADEQRGSAPRLSAVLEDILATPVSPELLPPKEGEIAQKTEDLVGPYELHDFFLYYAVRWGFRPRKVFRLAEYALGEKYDRATRLRWLQNFYRRFFAQQFKRSCLPDGPKVGSVTLSPRGDWRMPSDAAATLWLEEVERLTI